MRLIPILLFTAMAFPAWGEIKNRTKPPLPVGASIPITANDLKVIQRTREILDDASKWNHKDTRDCEKKLITYSLYCALYKASEEINKEFDHRSGALEEVRKTISKVSRRKHYEHRLLEYNNDPETKFEDIQVILKLTEDRMKNRLSGKIQ